MVDRQARSELADLWQQIINGSITMGEFSDRAPKNSEDHVVGAALDMFMVGYGRVLQRIALKSTSGNAEAGTRDTRMVGPYKLCRTERCVMERVILFLRSDLEYEWSPMNATVTRLNWWQVLLLIPGLLIAVFLWIAIAASTSPAVAFGCLIGAGSIFVFTSDRPWPFRCRSDYKAALASLPNIK